MTAQDRSQRYSTLPRAFFAYVGGTILLIVLSFAPSSVKSSYSWRGAILEVVLLILLFLGSRIGRWILIALGITAAIGSLALQTGSLDLVATGWSILALVVTAILFLPSMRDFTAERGTRRAHKQSACAG